LQSIVWTSLVQAAGYHKQSVLSCEPLFYGTVWTGRPSYCSQITDISHNYAKTNFHLSAVGYFK